MLRATDFFFALSAAMALLISLWLAVPAHAQDAPPVRSIFTINYVPVDVTASSAAAARDSAIAQSRQIAFSQIFKKLVAEEDLSLEPALTNAELADLVRAIDVTDEKSSATRYVAALSVTFDEEKLPALLERLNVTFTDSQTPPISLVPVAHYGGITQLDSPDNVWLIAWQRSATRASSLIDYVLPQSGAAYRRHVSAVSARQAEPKALIDLITFQQARDILLAFADIRFDIASRRYKGDFDVRRGPGQTPFMTFSLAQIVGESPQDMLERAIARINDELSALWKRQLLVEFSQVRPVRISAQFDGAERWRAMRDVLSGSRRLRNVRIPSLSLSSADITARFFGSFDALEQTFAVRGLRLVDEGENRWLVRAMTEREALQYSADQEGEIGAFVDPLQQQMEAERMQDEASSNPLLDISVPPWELGEAPVPQEEGQDGGQNLPFDDEVTAP